MVGPPEAGKSTLLYRLKWSKEPDWTATTTKGFQFEEISGGEGPNEQVVGVWDIGGG